MNTASIKSQIYQLARLYNVQTAYVDVNRCRQYASAASLIEILKALGAPVAAETDVLSAVRERTQDLHRRLIEPVNVAWSGQRPTIRISCPAGVADSPVICSLEMENGERVTWKINTSDMEVISRVEVEGTIYITRDIQLPCNLPHGYHKLTVEIKGNSCKTLIIAAPEKTYLPPGDRRDWGVFIPLYALQGKNSWGSGDYSALEELADWVGKKGGNIAATLPLLPLFLDEPYEPSPYVPVSRLLWNEFYVDVTGTPEFSACPAAQEMAGSWAFRKEISALRQSRLVNYRAVMALKRKAMEEMCRCILSIAGSRREEFRRFIKENPLVEKYASFRAVMEKRRSPWTAWEQRLHEGAITDGDYDESVKDYHLYAQWLAQQQVAELSANVRAKGMKMYFDLPLGVHPEGFDVWQHRDIFVPGAHAGAPPDAVFTGGQDWGFPPLHPEKIRENGYEYVRSYLGHHLKYADILRIDHVMGLHRLFWIPPGGDAGRGIYVRYHADELYAILAIESHRHRSVIIGEDLGIVPPYVRKAMSTHGLQRMYILYYELAEDPAKAMRSISPERLAGLNTHDMATFAAFWRGDDITERLKLGLTDKKGAVEEKKRRNAVKKALTAYLRGGKFLGKAASGTRAALKACLAYLSASRAQTVLVNLEDLWLETRSQNVPGTGDKYPSWRQKARYNIEEISVDTDIDEILKEIDRTRRHKIPKEG